MATARRLYPIGYAILTPSPAPAKRPRLESKATSSSNIPAAVTAAAPKPAVKTAAKPCSTCGSTACTAAKEVAAASAAAAVVEEEIECSVCLDEFPISSLALPSSKCEHSPAICGRCLRQHIEEEVNGKGITRAINCPECDAQLEHHEIHTVCQGPPAGIATFARFDSLLCRRTIETMPDFVWCSGKACGSGQIHDGGDDIPIMHCSACSAKTCFTHQLPYHDGMSCEQFDAHTALSEAAADEAWILRETKPCPNCGVAIEKNRGCCHMTCANVKAECRHQFCWHCSAPWQPGMLGAGGAHHHAETCVKYAPILEASSEDSGEDSSEDSAEVSDED